MERGKVIFEGATPLHSFLKYLLFLLLSMGKGIKGIGLIRNLTTSDLPVMVKYVLGGIWQPS